MPQTILTLSTRGQGLYEFTDQASAFVNASGREEGLLTVFVRHTSCSLLIQENADPDVRTDLLSFFGRLVPPASDPSMGWIVHRAEGPDDMPAHIKAALTQVSIGIPVARGAADAWHLAGYLSLRTSRPAAPARNRAASWQLKPDSFL
ncbi:secondary thiamine-phosphate synthase enzyme [Rhizobium leguminosarum]